LTIYSCLVTIDHCMEIWVPGQAAYDDPIFETS